MPQYYAPSPEEIAAACEEFQRKWTPIERKQHEGRRYKGSQEWNIPGADTAPLDVLPHRWYTRENRDDD